MCSPNIKPYHPKAESPQNYTQALTDVGIIKAMTGLISCPTDHIVTVVPHAALIMREGTAARAYDSRFVQVQEYAWKKRKSHLPQVHSCAAWGVGAEFPYGSRPQKFKHSAGLCSVESFFVGVDSRLLRD